VRDGLKHDRSDPLIRFVAIKSAERRRTAPANGIGPDNPHRFVFVEVGTSATLTDAVFAMSQRVGAPGRLIRVFGFVPRPVRNWL
jgi:predicted DCC family thiol-disulfide oxidoreductase YuxK